VSGTGNRVRGAVLAGLLAGCAAAPQNERGTFGWPDTFTARITLLALTQTLNARLLSASSATAVLEAWCRDHKLADPPRILVRLNSGAERPATPEQRSNLQVASDTPIRYRKVQLLCGSHVLAEAENWYVPERLSPEMNRLLDRTDTPYGKVIKPLEPYRRTLVVRMLWSPLPEGWETSPWRPDTSGHTGTSLDIPSALFEHHALVLSHEHQPLAEVHEVYERALVSFRPGFVDSR
jgi:chorismate-pyruvate lyase